MKKFVFFTKTNRGPLYIVDENGNFFKTVRKYNDHTITPVEVDEVGLPATDVWAAFRDEHGYINTAFRRAWLVEARHISEARYKWVGERLAERKEVKERKYMLKMEQDAKIAKLMETQPILATAENVGLLLLHLNKSNWGTWKLPSLTIGYTANQFNCEGKQISTISLDSPIEHRGEMVSKFKSGYKRGHLQEYKVV